jgi:hypothetical protein
MALLMPKGAHCSNSNGPGEVIRGHTLGQLHWHHASVLDCMINALEQRRITWLLVSMRRRGWSGSVRNSSVR